MKIVILNGSPRAGGNTEIMAGEFARGAEEKGHEVVQVKLAGKKIAGCLGCDFCASHDGVCVQKDDMAEIYNLLEQADLVAFASPIYWFSITAQLKCVIDRLYAKGSVGFHFNQVVLLLDSASEGVYEAAVAQYKAMNEYLGWKDRGTITISGMTGKGSMWDSDRLEEVCRLGKSL